MVIDTINRGEYLFRRGEPDEWIYVIQDGQIDLLVHENGQDRPISEVKTGESIASLLSVRGRHRDGIGISADSLSRDPGRIPKSRFGFLNKFEFRCKIRFGFWIISHFFLI